jgi:hypothetical protein
MKKLTLISAIISVFSTYALANDNFMNKILELYSIRTNGTITFEAKKISEGYELKLKPKEIYKDVFNKNYTIKVAVDEGPIVTKPSFNFAKAGLTTKVDVVKIFNKEIQKELTQELQKTPIINYEGIVTFTDTLKEKLLVTALKADNNETLFSTTPISIEAQTDLKSFKGTTIVALKKLLMKFKKDKMQLFVEGVKAKAETFDKPVLNSFLFGKNSLEIQKFVLESLEQKANHIELSLALESAVKKVDNQFLDLDFSSYTKTNDVNTIAMFKGIRENDMQLSLKNLGQEGILKIIEFGQKTQEIEEQLAMNLDDPMKKEQALAEYMAQLAALNNSVVDILNKTFITNKTRLDLETKLLSDKTSFLKLHMLYKAKPLQGDLNTAIITLLAQGLSIVDGDFEIQLDKELATSINPISIMILEMLKNKGFATEQNGLYHIKGKLKDGKLIINGKAYTLQELTTVLF